MSYPSVIELPDFATADYWADRDGLPAITAGILDVLASRPEHIATRAPWTPLDTAEGHVKRIDRDKLAEVLDGCFPGCDGPAAEDFIERYVVSAVDAVLTALPELMGGGER